MWGEVNVAADLHKFTRIVFLVLLTPDGLQLVQTFTQDKARLIALENLGAAPDSKNFERRDIGENIANLRDSLNGAPEAAANINSPAGGSAMARVMIMRRVLAQMKDGQPATKFFDFVLTDIQERPVPHLTFAEFLRLTNLAPGRYQATIEVKDMVTRKSSKQEAPFEIVP